MMKRLTMLICGWLALGAACAARAEFISVMDENFESCRQMKSGAIYVFTTNMFIRAASGESAMSLTNGTAGIIVPAGVEVTLLGGAANGTVGGGAGIEVASGAKLYVYGDGVLKGVGGDAAAGLSGEAGTSGRVEVAKSGGKPSIITGFGGGGGSGGNGGGGAGAGLGGRGGAGGVGVVQTNAVRVAGGAASGGDGTPGGSGGNGGASGETVVYGQGKEFRGGKAGIDVGKTGGAAGGVMCVLVDDNYFYAAFGGGGGGAGGGGDAAPSIGGGGGGGGSGGGGGGGSCLYAYSEMIQHGDGWGRGGFGAGTSPRNGFSNIGFRSKVLDTEWNWDATGLSLDKEFRHGEGGAAGEDGKTGASGAQIAPVDGRTVNGENVWAGVGDGWAYDAVRNAVVLLENGSYDIQGDVDLDENGHHRVTFPGSPVVLWLADGEYIIRFEVSDTFAGESIQYFDIAVNGADTVARVVDRADLAVFVNDDNIGGLIGKGWIYSPISKLLILDGSAEQYTLTGRDDFGNVQVVLRGNASVTLNNFRLSGTSKNADCIKVAEGARAKLYVRGANLLQSETKGGAGIRVCNNASLEIDSLDPAAELSATGGVDTPGIAVEPAAVLSVVGGILKVQCGSDDASCIGGGEQGLGAVTVNGGTITFGDCVTNQTCVIGSAIAVTGGCVQRVEDPMFAVAPTNAAGQVVHCVTVEMKDQESGIGAQVVEVVGPEDYGTHDIHAIDGKIYLWLPNGDHVFKVNGVGYVARVAGGGTTALPAVEVPYVDEGGRQQMAWAHPIDDATDTLGGGYWYVVTGAVATTDLKVNGTAQLILADDATLTANGTPNHAGIAVEKGNALTIYGQSVCTGKLNATGGTNAAGLGSGAGEECGIVTIDGGMVEAKGGWDGAGIGSGSCMEGHPPRDDSSSQITINGGRVRAVGVGCGAGIGGGWKHHGGLLVIAGGTVEAIAGGNGGFSLGDHAGFSEPLMRVEITGGNVRTDKINTQPTNGLGKAVWCVKVDLKTRDSGAGAGDEKVSVEGLEGYGVRDIYPIDGVVYLWLPDGEYAFKVDGSPCSALVEGVGTTAVWGTYLRVPYLEPEGLGMTERTAWAKLFEQGVTKIHAHDWYVVTGAVTTTELRQDGGTHLILADGATLAVTNDLIWGSDLIVYGQSAGSGRIEAVAGIRYAIVKGGIVHVADGEFYGLTVCAGTVSKVLMGKNIMVVDGGSVLAEAGTKAKNSAGVSVYPVEVNIPSSYLVPREAPLTVEGLSGYCVHGIYPVDGKICLWLPEGSGSFRVFYPDEPKKYLSCEYLIVNGVVTVDVIPLVRRGVTVNGRDVANLNGPGWEYCPKELDGDGCVRLTGEGPYVLSGTNLTGEVKFAVEASATVTLADLRLESAGSGGSCICATNGASVTLCLSGANTLEASAGGEGLSVDGNSRLVITNAPGLADADAELVARGGANCAGIAAGHDNAEADVRPFLEIAGGTVIVSGGENAAGIGGSFVEGSHNAVADMVISGGRVFATGGYLAAGIGSEKHAYASGRTLAVTGGYIEAQGGEDAAGIGGGLSSALGSVVVRGGTIRASRGESESPIDPERESHAATDMMAGQYWTGDDFRITGGSVFLVNGKVSPQPKNSDGKLVYCVPLDLVGIPSQDSPVVVEGTSLEVYGAHDLFPIDGKVYLWLPAGQGRVSVAYAANPQSVNVFAYSVSESGEVTVTKVTTGVTVNGRDVGWLNGPGWEYNPKAQGGDGYVELTGAGPYVLSGSNSAGTVMFSIGENAAVTLSNLCLRCMTDGECCIWATNNTAVSLFLAGTNTLDGSGTSGEGLCIENGCDLTIRAQPGLADDAAVLIARGGRESAAIATGRNGQDGTSPRLTIESGTVYAYGGTASAGIGGSYKTDNRRYETEIRICGGRVFAYGGDPGDGGGAGIGACSKGFVTDKVFVSISGGYVEAYGGPDASAIGGACDSAFNTVEITGGTVYAKRGEYGFYSKDSRWPTAPKPVDLGCGWARSGGKVVISGGSVAMEHIATEAPRPTPVNAANETGRTVYCVTVDLTPRVGEELDGKKVEIWGLDGYGAQDIRTRNGKIYLWLPDGEYEFMVNGMYYRANVSGGAATAVPVPIPTVENVEYLDWNGAAMEKRTCARALVLTGDMTKIGDDQWYAVTGTVTTTDLMVNGTAHLILADGATLTATGHNAVSNARGEPGIRVNENDTLFIYGQTAGSGRLDATGGDGAGIGSAHATWSGSVTINGGIVNARGAQCCAGIGGSNPNGWADNGHCGPVTINGGRVTAHGGERAAGIGGGAYGSCGEMIIRGGTVEASGGETGIGRGQYSVLPPGNLKILGGNVCAATDMEPTNARGDVYRVLVTDVAGGLARVEGLAGYGVHDVYSINGNIYLWLSNGEYSFNVNGVYYRATVSGGATTAVRTESENLSAALSDRLAASVRTMVSNLDLSALMAAPVASATAEPAPYLMALRTNEADGIDLTVGGGVPGCAYTLYAAEALSALGDGGAGATAATAYGPETCGANGTVTFRGVKRPSVSKGFFTIRYEE